MAALSSSITLINCTFNENEAGSTLLGYSGGIHVMDGSVATIQNCTFTGNHTCNITVEYAIAVLDNTIVSFSPENYREWQVPRDPK